MSKLPGKMTRKQHWVPRFYLRHFADSSGQLHAYSRQKGSFFRTNCENLCSMRDLYEVEHADATGDATDRFYAQNLIEVKLSELESRIAPLYDRFLERQKEDRCEDEGYSDGKAAVCELAMLKDAVLRAKAVSEQIGVRALLVHALNDKARQFYLKYGFSISPMDEWLLMLKL